MSVVRFAVVCDQCRQRSEEYTPWFTCRICVEDVCTDCIVPGSQRPNGWRDLSDEETGRATCKRCAGEPFPGTPECGSDCWDNERHSGLCPHAPEPLYREPSTHPNQQQQRRAA